MNFANKCFLLILLSFSTMVSAARLPKDCEIILSGARAQRETVDPLRRRFVTLSNGLKVLLFSDPGAPKSAAAMAVGVGSYQDPQGREGTFHFLEHMVFIGSREFPEVDGYARYISSNGGNYNGMTGGDVTVYPVDIKPEKFEGALRRMAAIFRNPLIDQE